MTSPTSPGPRSLPALPIHILGHIAPILTWTESGNVSRLPPTWQTESVAFADRERDWLLRELPTYSYTNVQEIVRGTRKDHSGPKPVRMPSASRFPSLSPPEGFDLQEAFRALNLYFLLWNGTEPCVRQGRMEELHELALRLPAGHIVRHSHARAISEGVLTLEDALALPEQVTLLPSNSHGLRTIVRKGLSESHLHLTGVTSAEETWANNLLSPIPSRPVHARSRPEQRLLTLNLFAGRLLALAVWYSLQPINTLRLDHLLLLQGLDSLYFARTAAEENYAVLWLHRSLKRTLEHTAKKALPLPMEYSFLRRWLSPASHHLTQRGKYLPSSLPESLTDRCRYLHKLHLAAHLRLVQLPHHPRNAPPRQTSPTGRDGHYTPDHRWFFLHETLFRYLVCRTHHWQMTAQQGATTGLSYFRTYYSSQHRKLTKINDFQYARLVFSQLRRWRGLRVLEGRVAPPKRAQQLAHWILAYAQQEDRRIRKFGLVVHFKKEDEDQEERPLRSSRGLRLRWGKRRRLVRDEGLRLYRLLQSPTPVTPFVVGIDACNLELATPPEVFAPVFRFLRELPISLKGNNRRYAPYFELDPVIRKLAENRRLGMTYHVGEDFRHLLSGLRAIHEVVLFLEPQPGDRLGHGTALALQPRDWLEHNGYQAVVPRLEWLDTLVWVHHFLGPGDDLVGELGIEDEIQRHSWKVYSEALRRLDHNHTHPLDQDLHPLSLWDAWYLRQLDPYCVDLPKLRSRELGLRPLRSASEESRRWYSVQDRVLQHINETVGSRNAYLLLALYWLSPLVREAGNEILVINMQKQHRQWLELCQRVEERMKDLIHERELVVEVNPSANRIIGPMARYGQHHVFQLTLDENRRLSRKVRVSVNTDNPAVCNTTLAHEHYLLGEILIGQGVPEAEVAKWLEWLRSNGEEYNFVRRLRTPEEDSDTKKLFDWLRNIRPTVRDAETRQSKLDAFHTWHQRTRLRSQGFEPDLIEQHPEVLDRILSLEQQLEHQRIAHEDEIATRHQLDQEYRQVLDRYKAELAERDRLWEEVKKLRRTAAGT